MWKKLLTIYIVFGFSLLILVGLSLYSFQRFHAYIRYADAVDHNYDLITELYKLKIEIIEAENKQRAFLLFEDSSFYQSYKKHVDEIKRKFTTVNSVLADNKAQQKKLFRLNIAIKSRLDYLETGITLGYPPTSYVDGQKVMSECVSIMEEMEKTETQLLRNSYSTKEFYEDTTPRSFRIVFIFTMVVFSISFGLLVQQFRSRIIYQRELEKKILELKQANEEWEQITYVASHDLQEPLRKIRTFSDRLLSKFAEQLQDEGQSIVQRIDAASARAQFLMQDIVNYNMIVFAREQYGSVDLQYTVNRLRSELEEPLKEKQALIKNGQLPVIKGYPSQIHLLFKCLIENSLKFSKPDSPCSIQIESAAVAEDQLPPGHSLVDSNYYRIQVKDNGIGFENEYADNIFKMFQRLHPQESIYEGRGLGLAIVKRIMTNHDGMVTADGKPGDGAIFTLYFPVR